ncbi:DNA replication complex GINS protein PSF2 isoform X2 [Cuculus canorus]|uniref:DNA replication complex GINS protein PSF2 isoform X2 n=1 Tax=Cuculus canorus TaxID=55661 RepID=UPI0023AA7E6A|nr:DNA replication complex GINS protein PSF2 isoform X2 [Cuculus canorus]
MEPAEAEFLAEKELVTIVPNFSLDRIHLIGGDLGPFNPGLPVEVPVWLAINLKQRQKCRLIPPEWMDVEKLEEIRDQERKEDTFTPMPSPYYMELTKLLLNYASDNIPKADEIRTLVKDTWDTRIAKLRLSADSFVRQQEAHAKPSQALAQLLERFCTGYVQTHTTARHGPTGNNAEKLVQKT